MKIKLVTFAPQPNYGTCLQSYALNRVLAQLGHDVEFLYNGHETKVPVFKIIVWKTLKFFLPVSALGFLQKRFGSKDPAPVILELPNDVLNHWLSRVPLLKAFRKKWEGRTLQKKKIYSFAHEDGNYKMKRVFTKRQYDEVAEDADLFVTGSDQIWNPFCCGFNPMMFLEFAGDKKRIAYASSIARPKLPLILRERIKEDLRKFSHIGVREEESVALLRELLGRDDIIRVADPTYLLSREEWIEFGNRAVIEFKVPEKYIFCYFIDGERAQDYKNMVEDVKRKTGIHRVITMNCTTNNANVGGDIHYTDGGPYEFVHLLQQASFVCMDSFHATLLSLILSVDFAHILKGADDNQVYSQNSRMYDLFARYGLLHKLYRKGHNEWMQPVDFERVQAIMQQERVASFSYLKNAIAK